ncbi:LuxR C-terminal-related transcriptional regulator [Rhodoluna limnophila]|uniref:LuxR C-terminal-related transcriptional regulator n=1 Tax=Rhodoluna limnophila TaxID=232537 RepID=UPI001105FAD2|nr:LuxR C-terminal-related transcriptional regulator [Rhodoluna limnophila]
MNLDNNLDHLSVALDVVLQSVSLADICRRAVLAPGTNNVFRGAHILTLDVNGQLTSEAFFGAELPANHLELANTAIFSRKLEYQAETAENPALIAIPFIKNEIPEAVGILVLKPGAKRQYISDEIVPLISKVAGYHLDAKKNSKETTVQTFSGRSSIEEMSTRQVKVLEFMAEGLTNAEIARRLLLSESTVRQESVKIYRSLNTDNRQEAVAQGRALGLISKIQQAN